MLDDVRISETMLYGDTIPFGEPKLVYIPSRVDKSHIKFRIFQPSAHRLISTRGRGRELCKALSRMEKSKEYEIRLEINSLMRETAVYLYPAIPSDSSRQKKSPFEIWPFRMNTIRHPRWKISRIFGLRYENCKILVEN